MTRPHVPAEILDLAHQRRAAREARDFRLADELRAAIEAGGWTVVDRGVDFDLRPLHPPDVVEEGIVRYGSSASVPSRLEETASVPASVIVVATDWPDDVERAVRAIRAESPDTTQIVVVADGTPAEQEPRLAALADEGAEVVRTTQRLGHGAAINAGVRRATGAMVILLDASVEATGDIVEPLAAPLRDPGVGVAGPWGFVVGRPAPLRGRADRRRRRDRRLLPRVPAGRLHRARAAGRAIRLLPQPGHLVEPRAA